MATLAARCGVSDRQIQRAINELVKRDIIGRVKRRSKTGVRSNNAYDLSPLIILLNQVAKAFPNGFPRQAGGTKSKAAENPPAIMSAHVRDGSLADDADGLVQSS
jgi:hypothetical protein